MKKFFPLLFLCAATFLATSCGDDKKETEDGGKTKVAVTGVTLDKPSASIGVGEPLTLVPTIAPANADNKSVTWASSAPSIASVNNGVVMGVAAGNATITAKTVDGGFEVSCEITVTKGDDPGPDPDTNELQIGGYVFEITTSEGTYPCEISISKLEGGEANQYVVDGMFDFTGLPLYAEYDAATSKLTLDGRVTDAMEEGSLWMYVIGFVDQTEAQGWVIASGETGEEPCLISVNEQGVPTAFDTELALLIADMAAGGSILGAVEMIAAGTPIATPALAPKKAVAHSKAISRIAGPKMKMSSIGKKF